MIHRTHHQYYFCTSVQVDTDTLLPLYYFISASFVDGFFFFFFCMFVCLCFVYYFGVRGQKTILSCPPAVTVRNCTVFAFYLLKEAVVFLFDCFLPSPLLPAGVVLRHLTVGVGLAASP